jgi:hypothetical protein
MGQNLTEVSVEELDAVWAQMIADAKLGGMLPGEKTVSMFAEEAGISVSTASRILKDETRFTKRRVTVNGKAGMAYKPIMVQLQKKEK